jgi:hypothetical protein
MTTRKITDHVFREDYWSKGKCIYIPYFDRYLGECGLPKERHEK